MISNGTITTGQGTPSITVEAEPGANVTATMDVGGLAPECPTSASGTFSIQSICRLAIRQPYNS